MNFIKPVLKAPLLVLAFFILLVAKLIQPVIRFQLCIVGFHRYGHLALEPEIFLAEKEISKKNRQAKQRVISIWSFGPTSKQSNRFLAKKWKEELSVCPSWLIGSLHKAGQILPFLKLDQAKLSITGNSNGLDKTNPHISLSDEEIAFGKQQIAAMGIDPDKPYVCLIVRDGGYYKSKGDFESAGFKLLNFDINDFAGVAEELIDNGFQVIRMGSGTESPFSSKPEGVVDYAVSEYRSEFLDVYLAATCKFAVSTQTGPDAVCMLFRRPVLYVDVTRYGQFFFGSNIATWSPVRLFKNGELLNLSEVINSEVAWIKDPNGFLENGITQQKSSKEELKVLTRSYIHTKGGESEIARRVRSNVSHGLGERGKLQFGDVTACLAPDVEQILGDWVMK
jgi:putative glycosyltransferase (TIGR04372 family)